MRKIITTGLMLSTLLVGSVAMADDPNYVNTNDDTSMSTANANDMNKGYLSREAVSIKPMVGVIAFTDPVQGNTSRGAVGLGIDANATSLFSKDWRNLYIGPSTGVIVSHLGDSGSNFFGSNSNSGNGSFSGSNLLIIPADLKVGYAITDGVRLSAHGGGNVIYQSIANNLNLGSTSDSNWKLRPNVGGDVEFGFGKNVALLLRPDWTLSSGDSIFTGTLGLGVTLG